jgi:hypothetical protein
LTRSLSSDPVESLFANVRLRGGCNVLTDCRTAEYALRQILRSAPCHNAHIIRNWLNNNFPERWIGTYGLGLWPARSPDPNQCDFFLWGYIKNLVYAEPIGTIDELRNRIEDAATVIRNAYTLWIVRAQCT